MAFKFQDLNSFREIWCVDFEFQISPGGIPRPVCCVAHEVITGRRIRKWQDELSGCPPYSIDDNALFCAYYASAELGCHLALGWESPHWILDLFAEFRCWTNGKCVPGGSGLIGALKYFGLDSIESSKKEEMRQLALRGGPWSPEEKVALLDYCESDVVSLKKLLQRTWNKIEVPYALLRGRYMKAAARMEHVGIPIDRGAFTFLTERWSDVESRLIEEVDKSFGVYEGGTFKMDRWKRYLSQNQIAWPVLPSGRLDMTDDTFKEMARVNVQITPLRELRATVSKMRLSNLAVGDDGRNRCLLSAFKSKTGRNQPSNAKFIFGPAKWIRGFIRPSEGCGLAYIDWCQQEFGIAAALSADPKMMEAYFSDDPYLAFGKQANVLPASATKETHKEMRNRLKECSLGVLFGMGEESLARKIQRPIIEARQLLKLHKSTYARFWSWSDACVDKAAQLGELQTVFGWKLSCDSESNERSIRNFPMQANGAEILRLACSLITEAGIEVCAPIHDAILISAPLERLGEVVAAAQEHMASASRAILGCLELRSESKVIKYPERYQEERGEEMWRLIWELVSKAPGSNNSPANGLDE